MECRRCSASLSRPGDYCLVCRTANADCVVVDAERDRTRVTVLRENERVGTTEITTTPEGVESDEGAVELRNFAGLIADEVHRKRPEEVYAAGDRTVITRLHRDLSYELKRVEANADDPVEAVCDRRGERSPEVVEAPLAEKISGTHTTLVGERRGRDALTTVAEHPHVKKVIPGPIESGGAAGGGVHATATRADTNGNLGLRVTNGSSVQENRVVTTAGDREVGEVIREDLNDALAAESSE